MNSAALNWLGRWRELKARMKSLWGDGAGDDVPEREGDDQRIAKSNPRPGESREEMERRLDHRAINRID